MIKCYISKYDKSIKEFPFKTIKIDEAYILQPENDYLGEKFAENIKNVCKQKGFEFKFYTLSELKDYKYEIVVY